jgi:hypothetical protein
VNRFFKRNLDGRGRLARGVWGTLLLIAGILVAEANRWCGLALAGFGMFAIFEALRGWCIVRACGIRTKF